MNEKLKYKIEKQKINNFYSLLIAIILLAFLSCLITILITTNLTLGVQQVLIAFIGLFSLITIEAFKKCLESISYTEGFYITNNSNYKTVNTYYEKQDLTEAASEIQSLLNQLSKNNPPKNEQEEIEVANEVVEEIKQDAELQEKIETTVKAGRVKTLINMINHPLAAFIMSAVISSLYIVNTDEKEEK